MNQFKKNHNLTNACFNLTWEYPVYFENHSLTNDCNALKKILSNFKNMNMIIIADKGLMDLNSEIHHAVNNLNKKIKNLVNISRDPIIIPGGEHSKNDSNIINSLLSEFYNHNLCRNSLILVVGGGAVLDVGSYAASIYHRGIKTIRIPSTTLSQCDSGVAVKNGINSMGQKNMIGSFSPPVAVINDFALLNSLDHKDFYSGFSEIVKVALLKDKNLFSEIENISNSEYSKDKTILHKLIKQSCLHHLSHITNSGDPFERSEARPLDLGHWSAHKLEILTNFEITHGEAVSIGLIIDLTYGTLMGILPPEILKRTKDILHNFKLPTTHPILKEKDNLLQGLEDFRQHLGGELCIPLISEIGVPIDLNNIDIKMMKKAISLTESKSL